MREELNPEAYGTLEEIKNPLDNNRIWIGYDKEVFEAVQTEAFRLGYSWIDGSLPGDSLTTTHQRLSKANPGDVAWVSFLPMELMSGNLKVMGYNSGIYAEDFDKDIGGVKITLEDMKKM